jgi:uncharacterized iron-regulated membrane protein
MADEPTLREQLTSPWPWHRWVGLVAAAFLGWLAVTGMLVGHAADLGLNGRPVTTGWVLDLWGVPEPEVGTGYLTPAGWLAEVEGRCYLGATALPAIGALRAVQATDEGVLLDGGSSQLLLAPDGAIIEVGVELAARDPARALAAEPLPEAARAAVAHAARAAALDWERVLRDLHAWRPLGRGSRWASDLLGIALLGLSITGAVMFVQRARRQRALDAD